MEKEEYGEIGYAVVDVEALMLGPVKVVEMIACVITSASTGDIVFAEKHVVYQPRGEAELTSFYGQPSSAVKAAIRGYTKITGDNPVHDDPAKHPPWNAVRNRLRKILRRRAIKVYAKGAALERTVLGSALDIQDLEWYGCPRFAGEVHDPLAECLFFSKYIPELRHFYFEQQQPQDTVWYGPAAFF